MANSYGTPDKADLERARAVRVAAEKAAKDEVTRIRAVQVKALDRWRDCGSH